MLKANPNSDERFDLLSEFALLKEVENTNVIKLIGACTTDDGPLCIIMEYARLVEQGINLTYATKPNEVRAFSDNSDNLNSKDFALENLYHKRKLFS